MSGKSGGQFSHLGSTAKLASHAPAEVFSMNTDRAGSHEAFFGPYLDLMPQTGIGREGPGHDGKSETLEHYGPLQNARNQLEVGVRASLCNEFRSSR
jgi:hypothetical protein